MKIKTALAVLTTMLGAQPALACRVLNSSVRFHSADIVVDGQATCLKKSGECNLKVEHVGKGLVKRGKVLRIVVDDAPQDAQERPDEIILSGCAQTFEPTQAVSTGRFYLRKRGDGTLYAFVPPDLKETEN